MFWKLASELTVRLAASTASNTDKPLQRPVRKKN
jgi:hypothetical protein